MFDSLYSKLFKSFWWSLISVRLHSNCVSASYVAWAVVTCIKAVGLVENIGSTQKLLISSVVATLITRWFCVSVCVLIHAPGRSSAWGLPSVALQLLYSFETVSLTKLAAQQAPKILLFPPPQNESISVHCSVWPFVFVCFVNVGSGNSTHVFSPYMTSTLPNDSPPQPQKWLF